ncbi:hypothetical protein L3Q82_025358 [Scortum barcoo]|uniref:Uncharacterized protein n=1 Tax=Scortum barcoo TaxID=214431 RepID=A0ACB8WPR1_9TELE|nr:hypothetical protein L3Q82_025358 [Scortum barcoo]
MKKETTRTVTSPGLAGVTGAPPWSQAWGWGCRQAPGGRVPLGGGEVLPQVEEFKYLGVLFTRWLGRSLRDRVRSSGHSGGARSRAAAPSHREESAEMAWASVSECPLDASLGRCSRLVMSHREEAPGRPRTRWRDYALSAAGLGTPRGSPRKRAGGSVWGEGSLGISLLRLLPPLKTRSRIQADEDGWMDGY